MDEREPKMLRAFTSLEVNSAGQYDLKHIKSELLRMGRASSPATAAPLRPVMHMPRTQRASAIYWKKVWLQ